MNIDEMISLIRFPGRYEVITRKDGSFVVIPLHAESVLITRESHQDCIEFFRKKHK
ncbi:hypothetical protein AH715_003439 [Salmonella enterica subsp. enterica]|nr:hypothetical protein [Salmonella enterica subsp. salamae]EEC0437851.1 hypothetical protein [Salmonella enterica subsp. enterica]EGR9571024.1 hypothetical protein [Salmonella enterica subsp. enterica serovar Grumpensis]EHW1157910.1 hypothetical protein [Salmonella enterica subsp. enterica serovar Takoradi]EKR0896863.1 hypothetical protein [Salmonella enterica]